MANYVSPLDGLLIQPLSQDGSASASRRRTWHRPNNSPSHYPSNSSTKSIALLCGCQNRRSWGVCHETHLSQYAAASQQEMAAALHSPSREFRRLTISLKVGALKCLVLGALTILCLFQVVSCVRHPATSQLEVRGSGDAPFRMGGFDGEMHEEVSRLMQHQLAQLERQEALEAIAEPYLHRKPTGRASMLLQAARGEAAYGVPPEGPMNSMMDFGSLLAGEPQDVAEMNPGVSTQVADMDGLGGPMTVDRAPYSFLNWGQIGGMMQNPALAHTGMPVYMPRQVVGTTVGLDFDSPATFHGPLLVLLMVCILIFFVVMLLCCWMVKSKRKHDKYMAEKLPR